MFEENVPLSKHSNYKIGGPARYFLQVKTPEQVLLAAEKAKALKLPIFILGGGTNLLIPDEGYQGLVLLIGFDELTQKEDRLTVGAGVSVKTLLEYTIEHELSGLEWAGGLPGSVGGAIWGNAGAFGGEIKDSIEEVTSIDISAKNPKIVRRNNAECQFTYRSSIFKVNSAAGIQEVIISATFRLKKGERETIRIGVEEKIQYRQNRQPLEYPNIGSIFKNIDWQKVPPPVQERFKHKIKQDPFPVLPTAVLIDAANLKGTAKGGAMVSPKHPNFIVNLGNASDKDVKHLMGVVKTEIEKQFGIVIEPEVILL